MTIDVKVLRWGNSFGLRLRKEDVRALGLVPGTTLRIAFDHLGAAHDLRGLAAFDLGGDLSLRHDGMWTGT